MSTVQSPTRWPPSGYWGLKTRGGEGGVGGGGGEGSDCVKKGVGVAMGNHTVAWKKKHGRHLDHHYIYGPIQYCDTFTMWLNEVCLECHT